MSSFRIRTATLADVPSLKALLARSIDELQQGFLSEEQIRASHLSMGLDTQLVSDGTYVVVENSAGPIVGCGGWSFRNTLYGGDTGTAPRDAGVLDPARDAARVRAMYTHPEFTRRGIGKMILLENERRARAAGFKRVELMATLSGVPLYRACGYCAIEAVATLVTGPVAVPGLKMGKDL